MRLVMHWLGGGGRVGSRKCPFQTFLELFVMLGFHRIVVAGDLRRPALLFVHRPLLSLFKEKWETKPRASIPPARLWRRWLLAGRLRARRRIGSREAVIELVA